MTTKKISYREKLLDPRWQKRRLEILSRDNWTCQICGDKESTLHVHHKKYRKDADPWDYDDGLLVTVCSDCHDSEHLYMHSVSDCLIETLLLRGANSHEIQDISEALYYGRSLSRQDFARLAKVIADFVSVESDASEINGGAS